MALLCQAPRNPTTISEITINKMQNLLKEKLIKVSTWLIAIFLQKTNLSACFYLVFYYVL